MQLINLKRNFSVYIIILIAFLIMGPVFAITEVHAYNFKESDNLNTIDSKVSITLENNLLSIYELKDINFSENSVIPIPNADDITLLREDFFYEKRTEYKVNYSYKNWGMNYFDKSQSNLIASLELIELIQHLRNKTVDDENLNIGFLRSETEYKGQAITYNKLLMLNNKEQLKFEISLKSLQGTNYYRERFAGVAVPVENQDPSLHDYDYNLYGETEVYKIANSNNLSSSGYGLDIMTEYAFAPHSYIKLELDNLLGKINWNNIEYETGHISTNTATRDAEGNVTYTATMKGTERSINIEQPLPMRAKVTLNLYTDNFTWQPQLSWSEWKENDEENDNYIKPYLKIIYPVNSKHIYYVNINFKTGTPLIGLRYNKFSLEIVSDRINLKKAKSLGGVFVFNFKF